MNETRKVIYLINSKSIVFDLNLICDLRENYRVCGHLIGSLANNSQQVLYYGAPLLLSCEETKLLISELKIADLYKVTRFNTDRLSDDIVAKINEDYNAFIDKLYNEQNDSYKLKRLNELATLKEKIVEGKRKSICKKIDILKQKLTPQTSTTTASNSAIRDTDEINDKIKQLENELNNLTNVDQQIKPLSREDINIETFVQTPEFLLNNINMEKILFNEEYIEETRAINYKYLIFKHLWSKGYYLTSAAKFGGDFLVYNGDPLLYHSKYILLCLTEHEYKTIKYKQLIEFGRLATNVKKTYLLAYVKMLNNDNCSDDNYKIMFTCINWSHI